MIARKTSLITFVLTTALLSWQSFFPQPVQAQDLQNLDQGGVRNCGGSFQFALERAEQNFSRLKIESSATAYVQAASDLAQLYWQSHQFVAAKAIYEKAYQLSQNPPQQREFALMLGNINATQTLYKQADKWWQLAQDETGADQAWNLSLELNRLRSQLRRLPHEQVSSSPLAFQPLQEKIRAFSEINQQKKVAMVAGLHLFEIMLMSVSDEMAQTVTPVRLAAINSWGQYIKQLSGELAMPQYQVQALRLNARAAALQADFTLALGFLSTASTLTSATTDLQFQALLIEQQRAQLYEKLRQNDAAKRAYQRAIFYIQQLRSDLPLFDEYGDSYHQTLLQPIYLGYIKLLFQDLPQKPAHEVSSALQQIRDVMEHSKRDELQEYLGERCSIEQLQQTGAAAAYKLAPESAILYPIVLSTQLEILLETRHGMQRYTVPLSSENLQEQVRNWVQSVRSGQASESESGSRLLWQALIAPLQGSLQQQKIKHLIIIPDASLRLLPFAALSDGEHYLIQQYRLSISPTLGLLKSDSTQISATERNQNLLAGMSEPGSVVNKLPENLVQQVLVASETRGQARGGRLQTAMRGNTRATRAMSDNLVSATAALSARRALELKQALALQGVEEEIGQLQTIFGSRQTTLLNQQFTASAFAGQVQQSNYSSIHIASHGVFGGDAEHTFIMAYDDLINLRQLQRILHARQSKSRLDLLSLSACETAEGDERAPLGLSGAALQANARSALGSLWSVSDQATSLLMQEFYRARLHGLDKAAALRQAQLYLLSQPDYQQAYYWAAFILVGNHL